MKKYRVYFTKEEYDYVDVEATDDEQAAQLAQNQIGSSWDLDDVEEFDAET